MHRLLFGLLLSTSVGAVTFQWDYDANESRLTGFELYATTTDTYGPTPTWTGSKTARTASISLDSNNMYRVKMRAKGVDNGTTVYSDWSREVAWLDPKTNRSVQMMVIDRAPTINLTTEGSLGWTHWGLANATDVNQKAGTTQASALANTGTPFQCDDRLLMAWQNGSPTTNALTAKALCLSGDNSAFSFTVPADTTPRLLTVYFGGWSSSSEITLKISDNSAPPVVQSYQDSRAYNRRIAVIYRASKAGQKLTVTYVLKAGSGNISLQGATIAPASASSATLAATTTTPSVSLDLTPFYDWVYWSYNNGVSINRKTGTQSIAALTTTGDVSSDTGPDVFPIGWSNGAPTTSGSSLDGLAIASGTTGSFTVTAPAQTTTRFLSLFPSFDEAPATVTIQLNGSVVYRYSLFPNGSNYKQMIVAYKAPVAGQQLRVTYAQADKDGAILLRAAALSSESPNIKVQ